jgi:ATP-binding cassette subfamily B protein
MIRRLTLKLELPVASISAALALYYALTLLGALLDGVGVVFLVSLFTTGSTLGGESDLPSYIGTIIEIAGVSSDLRGMLPLLIGIFGLGLAIRFGLLTFDGVISATLRQRLQETIFRHYIAGDWAHMRSFSVGDAVGSNTQEALIVSKYLTSAISTVYFLLSALTIGGLAAFTSAKFFLAFAAIAFPLAMLFQLLIARQAVLSRRLAELRNAFASDITDRFNGLLQIHVESNDAFHQTRGLRNQREITRLEILIGLCQAVIGSFNLLLPLFCLIALFVWMQFGGSHNAPSMTLAASVGILGIRLANQLNGVVAAFGNLSRLSGSLFPVLGALSIPAARSRVLVPEPLAKVELRGVTYSYDQSKVIEGVSLIAASGAPLVMVGSSGKGKTTLANLVAGLYFPDVGDVVYVGASTGTEYRSAEYRARIGYVTQDIYLFQGSLRCNLASGQQDLDDAAIWRALETVGAADFVRDIGGLETESAEAGRSLSGGQRRRLGIARVLLSECDILIFDEISAGLDQQNRTMILKLVEELSKSNIVIFITHDNIQFETQHDFTL